MNLNDSFRYLHMGVPDDIARLKAAGYYQEAIARIDLLQEEEVTEQDEVAFADLIEREVVITPGGARARIGEERALAARNAHDDGERRRRGLHHDARRVESAALKLRNGETPVIIVPDRAESGCPVSSRCGGCTFRDISYTAELAVKDKLVRDAFERIGGFILNLPCS